MAENSGALKINIEKNIPMPMRKGARLADTVRSMDKGDSFLVPLAVRMSIYTIAGRAGIKVTTQREGDLLRVWRVA